MFEKSSGTLNFSTLENALYGPGQIGNIARELEIRGLKRALIVTGRTLGNSPQLDALVNALGKYYAGTFKGVVEHAVAPCVRAMVAEIERVQADVVISFGGGSCGDAAKIAVASVLAGADMTRSATTISYGVTDFSNGGRSIKYVAIPTTLSAGEFSYGAATTDDQGKKGSIIDPRIGPVFTVLDSELAAVTPDRLWLTSGVKCLDHAVEALYSAHRNPFADALASGALRLLLGNLPGSVSAEQEERIARRGHCLMAALLSNYAAMDTRYGLSHVVGHKCGPRWHIPHGVTSCIALPPSMRFMGKVAPERFGLLADTLEVDRGLDASKRAVACADRIGEFIAGLGVPTRLRDYDVKESELNDIVQMVLDQVTLSGTIGRPVTAAEMGEVVRACW